jgi:CheY-like chemotaxis protein
MDVQMPILDGLSAAARLREKGYDKPIIALTAHARESDRERCIKAGCNDFASKPINRAWLLQLLEHYLQKGSAATGG